MSIFRGHPAHKVAADEAKKQEADAAAAEVAQEAALEEEAPPLDRPPPAPATRPGWRVRNAVGHTPPRDIQGPPLLPPSPEGDLKPPQAELLRTLNRIVDAIAALEGFCAVSIASLDRGVVVGRAGEPGVRTEELAAAGTGILLAERVALEQLGLAHSVDEIMLALEQHYLILRPSTRYPHLLISALFRRERANLAMVHLVLSEVSAWPEP